MAQSDQQPVGSPFGAKTDGAEVVADIDLAGKTAIVTGGYSGIGLETVRALAGRGAAIVVPVRDMEKAAANLAGIGGNIRV
ncbi:MAG: SDR family NAD(P)-dependent oxidoreductase, partial [Parasphingopyxis sp.]